MTMTQVEVSAAIHEMMNNSALATPEWLADGKIKGIDFFLPVHAEVVNKAINMLAKQIVNEHMEPIEVRQAFDGDKWSLEVKLEAV